MSKLVTGGNYAFTDSDGVTELWVNYPDDVVTVTLPSLANNQGREIIVKANAEFIDDNYIKIIASGSDDFLCGESEIKIFAKYGFFKFKAGDKWELIDGFDELGDMKRDYQGHMIYYKREQAILNDWDFEVRNIYFPWSFSSIEYYKCDRPGVPYQRISDNDGYNPTELLEMNSTYFKVQTNRGRDWDVLVIGRWYENPTTDLDTSGFYRVLANGGYRVTSDGFSRIA